MEKETLLISGQKSVNDRTTNAHHEMKRARVIDHNPLTQFNFT